jgi:hypothetical protein
MTAAEGLISGSSAGGAICAGASSSRLRRDSESWEWGIRLIGSNVPAPGVLAVALATAVVASTVA